MPFTVVEPLQRVYKWSSQICVCASNRFHPASASQVGREARGRGNHHVLGLSSSSFIFCGWGWWVWLWVRVVAVVMGVGVPKSSSVHRFSSAGPLFRMKDTRGYICVDSVVFIVVCRHVW